MPTPNLIPSIYRTALRSQTPPRLPKLNEIGFGAFTVFKNRIEFQPNRICTPSIGYQVMYNSPLNDGAKVYSVTASLLSVVRSASSSPAPTPHRNVRSDRHDDSTKPNRHRHETRDLRRLHVRCGGNAG